MDAMTKAALKVLYQRLGLWGALHIIVRVIRGKMTGAPFAGWPKAQQRRERESRQQLGPAILVYRALLKRYSPSHSLLVTSDVVTASGRAFLNQVLSELDIDHLISLPNDQRSAYLTPILSPIPNALFELSFDTENKVRFTVKSCRFVGLCAELGHPELAPLFCAVDDHFFRHDLPQVNLERATTIAHGGEQCPFILSLSTESTASSTAMTAASVDPSKLN